MLHVILDTPFRDTVGATLLGWSSILTEQNITASENNADAPYLADHKLYTSWSGSDGATLVVDAGEIVDLEYFAVAGLSTDGLDLEVSDDGVAYSTVLSGLTAQEVLFESFAPVAGRYFRVTCSGATTLAVLALGVMSWFPPQRAGFAPPDLALQSETLVNRAQAGTPLGQRILSQAAEFTLTADLARKAFFDLEWKPFYQHAIRKPFFLRWNPDEPPAFCWVDSDINPVSYRDPIYMRGSVKCRAIAEPA